MSLARASSKGPALPACNVRRAPAVPNLPCPAATPPCGSGNRRATARVDV